MLVMLVNIHFPLLFRKKKNQKEHHSCREAEFATCQDKSLVDQFQPGEIQFSPAGLHFDDAFERAEAERIGEWWNDRVTRRPSA
jgi:hypothetical protein